MTSGLSRNSVNEKRRGLGGNGEKNVNAERVRQSEVKRDEWQPFSLSFPSHGTTETTLEIQL